MKTAYNYKDILLQPRYSSLNSRSEANTSVKFGPMTFALPVVPANMKTIIDENLAVWLAQNNYFYVMHRFDIDTVEFCKRMIERGLYTSISLGVNEDSYEVLDKLVEEHISPTFLTIDIAHFHSIKAELLMAHINEARYRFPWFTPFIIGGNICTEEGVIFSEKLGCSAVKVGISFGGVCLTRYASGFGKPMYSTILDCAKVAKVPVIADGGIQYTGDIAKAFVAGATMVMAGGLFSGHLESPGEVVEVEGKHHKKYFGSASAENKGVKKNVEGKQILVPLKGTIADTYQEIKEALQSSISYAGGKDLSAFLEVEWVVVH